MVLGRACIPTLFLFLAFCVFLRHGICSWLSGSINGKCCMLAALFSLVLRALEEMFDRPIEIYSSESEGLQPMKIDFDASGVSLGKVGGEGGG